MDYYIDTTPIPTPSSFYTSHEPHGRAPNPDHAFIGSTRFLATGWPEANNNVGGQDHNSTAKIPIATRKNESTPLISDGSDFIGTRAATHERPNTRKDLEISKITQDRIKLLAIKYASDTTSAEMIARLEILNSRLIERAPRVTTEQINFLENSISSVKSIEQSRLDRAKRLGLAT